MLRAGQGPAPSGFRFGYDNLGRKASLAYPNGDETTYSSSYPSYVGIDHRPSWLDID